MLTSQIQLYLFIKLISKGLIQNPLRPIERISWTGIWPIMDNWGKGPQVLISDKPDGHSMSKIIPSTKIQSNPIFSDCCAVKNSHVVIVLAVGRNVNTFELGKMNHLVRDVIKKSGCYQHPDQYSSQAKETSGVGFF